MRYADHTIQIPLLSKETHQLVYIATKQPTRGRWETKEKDKKKKTKVGRGNQKIFHGGEELPPGVQLPLQGG